MVIIDNAEFFNLKLNVPNGLFTLQQFFGKEGGLMDTGCYCCFCTCCDARRVAVMITKNTIRYQCPISNVPTKDNVMVSLDIGVNFHIGRHDPSLDEEQEK